MESRGRASDLAEMGCGILSRHFSIANDCRRCFWKKCVNGDINILGEFNGWLQVWCCRSCGDSEAEVPEPSPPGPPILTGSPSSRAEIGSREGQSDPVFQLVDQKTCWDCGPWGLGFNFPALRYQLALNTFHYKKKKKHYHTIKNMYLEKLWFIFFYLVVVWRKRSKQMRFSEFYNYLKGKKKMEKWKNPTPQIKVVMSHRPDEELFLRCAEVDRERGDVRLDRSCGCWGWVFVSVFDMKEGTKPEGSELITRRGCALRRSALIIRHPQKKPRGV